jgi:hypothetical protein
MFQLCFQDKAGIGAMLTEVASAKIHMGLGIQAIEGQKDPNDCYIYLFHDYWFL